MQTQPATQPADEGPEDFSVVLGGPLYQLWRRTRLAGGTLQLLHRRIIALALIAWLPLLILSIIEGSAIGGKVALPFLHDIEMHVRLLLSLPLLIVAELVVHQRMRPMVMQFVNRKLIPESEMHKFDAAIESARRLRNSVLAEVLLILFVYGVGVLLFWRTQVALDVTSWYGFERDGKLQPSLAGWWMGCVSLPVFQFLLLRWYFRMFVWTRFLWHVSRIDLKLMPLHPDRCGGLGFLAAIGKAFMPLLLAQGALLSGVLANRIFYAGGKLPQFQLEIFGLVAVMILAILGPLFVFTPKLATAKRIGLGEYGSLAHHYTRDFDRKWLRGGAPADEPFIGSADIQSLADLGNSFEVVTEMRLAPITKRSILQLAITTLLPLAPLLLTMIPLAELLDRLLKVVF